MRRPNVSVVDMPHAAVRPLRIVEYLVSYATVPCGIAVFRCGCGAASVEFDLKRAAPDGWVVREDGSHLCPRCRKRTTEAH